MKKFQELLDRSRSTASYDKMKRAARPLQERYGIHHFWYYSISNEGDYAYFGTHDAWSDYCLSMSLIEQFPCLRHPAHFQSGLYFMKEEPGGTFDLLQTRAKEKFSINFHFNMVEKTTSGIEAFGVGSSFFDKKADERLVNELPLLKKFIRHFRENNKKMFQIVHENRVNIASEFGSLFYEKPASVVFPSSRQEFLTKIGFGWVNQLTTREKDIMSLVAKGGPASHIAEKLSLKTKTVENYLASLKDKLFCETKSELIEKAKDFVDLQ